MNYNKSALAAAIAATLGGASTAADAAIIPVALASVKTYSNNGTSMSDLSSSTATFEYDTVTNLVTQTGGTFVQRLSIVPNVSTLFRHTITGLVIGNGGAASASTYVCVNGNFGQTISFANLCGNYNFGANFVEESTISYGPGTTFARTIGGDDMLAGNQIQQSINQLNGMNSTGIAGTVLFVTNSIHTDDCAPGGTSPCPPGINSGYDWTFSTNVADTDGDGMPDVNDNCRTLPNANQVDSNADGFGNRCDADLNNNGSTNAFDTPLYRAQLGQPSVPPLYNIADFNTNGSVNAFDTPIYRSLLGSPPGPGKAAP
ncbi:MAG: thrombospondin type 3 repeat-containing protein [Gammaproteobacteria bacterium]|nr:thrombospondin type 3 repeat-containing protein [Gammaproteobacteria bacterium]